MLWRYANSPPSFMRIIPFKPFRAIALSLVLTASALGAPSVTYPGYGNADLEEGSIELWLVPMGDFTLESGEGKGRVLYQFLELSAGNSFSCSVTWTQNGNKGGFRVRCHEANGAMLPLSEDKRVEPQWNKEQPGKLALVWKDHWMGFYVDGKLFKERTQNAGLKGNLNELALRLGSESKAGRPWLLQGVRISSVARSPEELSAATLTPDAATLLFDVPGDWKHPAKQTQPRIIAHIADQAQAGAIDGEIHLQKIKDVPGLVLQ